MGNGIYPLGVKTVLKDDKDAYDTNIRKAAKRLIKFENKLMGKSKKRKRKSEDDEGKLEVKEKRKKIDKVIPEDKKSTSDSKLNKKSKGGSKDENLAKFIEESERKIKKKLERCLDEEKNRKQTKNVEKQVKNAKIKKQLKNGVVKNSIEKKRKRKKVQTTIIDNIECVFERNSGTWVVYNVSSEKKENGMPFHGAGYYTGFYIKKMYFSDLLLGGANKCLQSVIETRQTPSKSSETTNKYTSDELVGNPSKSKGTSNKTKESPLKTITDEDASLKLG